MESVVVGKLNPELVDIKNYKGLKIPFRIIGSIGDIIIIRHLPGAFKGGLEEAELNLGAILTYPDHQSLSDISGQQPMKNRELFSNLITVPPVFVRIDGRAFHRLADRLSLARPSMNVFTRSMVAVTQVPCFRLRSEPGFRLHIFGRDQPVFFSLPFGGRVEKIDSVAASYAASAFSTNIRPEKPGCV